jgi:hypothetical protein
MKEKNQILKFNRSYLFWEYGHWTITTSGTPIWIHAKIASSFIPWPKF